MYYKGYQVKDEVRHYLFTSGICNDSGVGSDCIPSNVLVIVNNESEEIWNV
jgi:hypothetical protein